MTERSVEKWKDRENMTERSVEKWKDRENMEENSEWFVKYGRKETV
jgi:endonuclease III